MHCSLSLMTAAVASALTVGCAEQRSPLAPAEGLTDALRPVGSRGSASSLVERGTVNFGFLIVDQARGLTTVIGNSFDELAVLCAGGEAPAEHDAVIVIPPTEAIKLLVTNAEAEVIVWQFASGDFCGELATTPPYAEGTARLTYVDNEATDFPVGPGGNAASVLGRGTVTTVGSGEKLHYNAIVHIVLPPGATSIEEAGLNRSEIRLN